MTRDERAPILDALERLLKRDADLVTDPLATFLPIAGQRHALWRDTLVILGGRGAGKTALFQLVNGAGSSARLRAFYEDDRVLEATWFDAFSQQSLEHPDAGVLEARAAKSTDLGLHYASAWEGYLLGDKPWAKAVFARDVADLARSLRTHASGKWDEVGGEALAREDYAAARAQCEKALDLARSATDPSAEADLLIQLGRIDLGENKPALARSSFARAVELCRRASRRAQQANACSLLAVASDALGDKKGAEEAWNTAAELAREAGDASVEWFSLSMLSFCLRSADPVAATRYAVQALSASQRDAEAEEIGPFTQLARLAADADRQSHAELLLALATVVANRCNERTLAAAELRANGLQAIDFSHVMDQADAAYARDRGWSIVKAAFPDVSLPSGVG